LLPFERMVGKLNGVVADGLPRRLIRYEFVESDTHLRVIVEAMGID